MLNQMILAATLMAITAVVQAAFMLSGFRGLQALKAGKRHFGRHHATLLIVVFVLYMFAAVMTEIVIWAAVYEWIGAISAFDDALYVSASSFTTIGYGNVQIAHEWRLLVALEGANGMIVFGWATALVIAAIQHFELWPDRSS